MTAQRRSRRWAPRWAAPRSMSRSNNVAAAAAAATAVGWAMLTLLPCGRGYTQTLRGPWSRLLAKLHRRFDLLAFVKEVREIKS